MKNKKKKLAVFLALLTACVIILAVVKLSSGPTINQDPQEIVEVMKVEGYENIELGRVVSMMGPVWGPCITLSADYKGAKVHGGYCTPAFSPGEWGVKIVRREVSSVGSVIEDSYK